MTDPERAGEADRRRYVWTMVIAGAVSAVVYLLLLRYVSDGRLFANFFDLQARALLDGHLDVPPGSLGIEAFVVRGQHYMYFPPGPALLRMPLFLVTDRYDGRLTGVSMLAAWTTTTVLFGLLIWRVRTILRAAASLGRLEAVGYGLLLVAGSAGSVVLYLASIPWVYHEAYAWAMATAVGAVYCLLGLIERPSTAGVIATGLFTVAAALSRTTAGIACASAVLLTAIWFLTGRRGADGRRLWWQVALAGVVPLVVGGAFNWAKFRHPFLFPLDDQVFTGLSRHRRDALAANGGDLASPDLFLSTFVNYFRPDGIRFISIFPFITLPPEVARSYGGGFLDQTYRTGSITAFMPLLCSLGIWGVVTAFRPSGVPGAALFRIPLLAVLAIPGGIMFYAYIAHRYTSEFMPLLMLAGAIGLVDVSRRVATRGRRFRLGFVGVVSAATLFSVAASLAVGLTTQALANPGAPLAAYVATQERVSGWTGDPVFDHVAVSDVLPPESRADQLRIVGDCQALFVGTGDGFAPWSEVETRRLVVWLRRERLAAEDADTDGRLRLATFVGHSTSILYLERRADRLRFVHDDAIDRSSDWFESDPGVEFLVTVNPDFGNRYLVTGADAAALTIQKDDLDDDLRSVPNVLVPTEIDAAAARAIGLVYERGGAGRLELCDRLLAGLRE